MTTIKRLAAASALLALAGALRSEANVIGVDLGTGLPPSTLGGYAVTPFDPGSILGSDGKAHIVNGIGDLVGFPNQWLTWGQGYTGYAYISHEGTPLTLQLNGNVEAVYLYMEPDFFLTLAMTATDSSGASVSATVNGFFGSNGVGFYESIPGNGEYLTSITITTSGPFAIGEFGMSVLTPDVGNTSLLLALSLGALSLGRFGRSHRKA